MSVILVDIEDTFDQWRKKTNSISIGIGDFKYLNSGDTTVVRAVNRNYNNIGILSSLSTDLKSSLVDAINEVDENTDINTITIGALVDLTTSDKSSVVNAINEIDGQIGNLPSLSTDAKSNLVSAINEVDNHTDTNTTNIGNITNLPLYGTANDCVSNISANANDIYDINIIIGDSNSFPYTDDIEGNLNNIKSSVDTLQSIVGNDTLLTTASYTTGAINELFSSISLVGDLSLLTTDDKTSVVNAINEVDANTDAIAITTGDLTLLETGVKTDLVSAINEVATNTVAMALILG